MSEDQIEDCLRDYAAWAKKWGITIDGCGCCDSPFLSNWNEQKLEEKIAESVKHLRDVGLTT